MIKIITAFADISYSNAECRVYSSQGSNIMSLGRRSYIVSSSIEGMFPLHIIVGNYTSIAHGVNFLINMNHPYSGVSTYPWTVIPEFIAKFEPQPPHGRSKSQIIVGNDVWIGRGVSINGGVIIGNGAVVAANAMVTKDVPPYAIVGGNPARVIKYRFSEETIVKLNSIKWWYWPETKILRNQRVLVQNVERFIDKFYKDDNKIERNSTVETALIELKRQGHIIYYFQPDLDESNPVWPNVMKEYLHSDNQREKQKKSLILGVPIEKTVSEELRNFISEHNNNNLNIYVVPKSPEDNLQIIRNADYYITTREFSCLSCVDYAYDYRVKVLSGLDCPVF